MSIMSRGSRIFPLILASFLVAFVYATDVLECPLAKFDLKNKVNITTCEKQPCRLRRKTVPEIRLLFSPDHEIKNLRTTVHAEIAGLPIPFIGVDGTSACGKLYETDGKTKVSCPLKKGQEYLYINSFKVLEQYPKIKLVVHWALTDPSTNKPVTCFEVPARITN